MLYPRSFVKETLPINFTAAWDFRRIWRPVVFFFHVSGIVRLFIKGAVLFLLPDWHLLEFGQPREFAALEVTHRNIIPPSLTRPELVIPVIVEASEVLNEVVFSLEAVLAPVGGAVGAFKLDDAIFLDASNVAL